MKAVFKGKDKLKMAEEKKIRVQDDLYMAVNGEWLKHAVIPDDRPTTGGFSDLDQNVEKLMMNELDGLEKGTVTTGIPEMKEAVKLYKKALDSRKRNEEGIKPVLPYLEKIQNITSLDDLNKKARDLTLDNLPLPFNYGVEADMKDARKNAFVILGPDIILPDTTYYEEGNKAGESLLNVYSEMVKKLLAYTPLSKDDQELYLKDTLAFDKLISKVVKSQEEWADYVKNYNPESLEEVREELKPFDFQGFLASVYGEKVPSSIIVYDPKAIKEFSSYFNKETFNLYIHWAYVKTLVGLVKYTSEELSYLGNTYRRALIGLAKDPTLEKSAYRLVSALFSEPLGVYYGRKFFGEEAKKDVVSLVKKIIEMYKERMAKNTFLEESTKKEAIKKLSTITIKMGYPDKIEEIYSKYKISDDDSLLVSVKKISTISIEDNLNKLYKPVDHTHWAMPGHMVNACYDPSANDITFPAAILQKPFYSLDNKVEENLGGIGAVIGHEISHAFDNNGASFDETGSLKNWWTKKDYAEFNKLTKAMIDEFDGMPFHGGKVNGKLIVSENIADNGGMAVTLAIMHTLPHPDFQAYFLNWGRIWCMKAKQAYMMYLLVNDVHAPAELRADMQPRNFTEWYEAFDVKEGDGMYLAPEKRVDIW